MVRRSRVGATLTCVAMLLVACATKETEVPGPAAAEAAPDVEALPQVAAIPTVPVPKRKPVPPAPVMQIAPQALIGMDQNAAMDLLGKTPDVRVESTATVWKYQTDDCRLELYFYLELPSQTYRALTYDLKTANPSDYATRSCLSVIKAKYGAQ